MLKFIKRILFNRSLEDVLNETKNIKVQGVLFKIRKLNTIDHLTGAKVLTQQFDVYRKDTKTVDPKVNKVKEHFRDVFLSCVLKPKLSRKDAGDATFVDEIFGNWEMANELYGEIVVFTYGKKKIRKLFKSLAN